MTPQERSLDRMEAARTAQLRDREQERQEAREAERRAEAPSFDPLHVVHATGAGYFVQSRTTAGTWYLVHGGTCSCAAGRAGKERCIHRTAVASFVAAENARHARPVAPVNVSALVD